jgi:hypothetical protein
LKTNGSKRDQREDEDKVDLPFNQKIEGNNNAKEMFEGIVNIDDHKNLLQKQELIHENNC